MFFKNKTETLENLIKGLEKGLDEKLLSLKQEITSKPNQFDEMNQTIKQLQTVVQKHDMAIEDLLDEWEEKVSDEKNVKEQFQEYEHREQQFLKLFETYQEQFWNIKHFAGKDKDTDDWAAQISLMEKNLEHYQKLCGISIIGQCGIEVDYDLHEVLEAIDTNDPSKDKKIADIYRCGYLYQGKVMKKAQVSAYRIAK